MTNAPKRIGAKTLQASFWLMTGVFYGRLANLAMTIILARILVPADFGLVALGTTLLIILTSVTDLSLANALIHHQDNKEADFHTAFTLSAIRGFLLAIVMVISGFVMAHLYNDPRLIGVCTGLAVRPSDRYRQCTLRQDRVEVGDRRWRSRHRSVRQEYDGGHEGGRREEQP
jgi:PST family polysaccharide transporter